MAIRIMAKKKNTSALGLIVVLLICAGVVMSLFERSPLLGVIAVLAGLGLLALLGLALRSKRCDICGNALQRKSYEWALEGAKKRVCPHCNQALARKQSKAAMKQFR